MDGRASPEAQARCEDIRNDPHLLNIAQLPNMGPYRVARLADVVAALHVVDGLDEEEVDERLVGNEPLVLLGEEELLEEKLRTLVLDAQRLGARVLPKPDLRDQRLLVQKVVRAALYLVPYKRRCSRGRHAVAAAAGEVLCWSLLQHLVQRE